MNSSYDTYYQTHDLFGKAYPELLNFLGEYPKKGRLLDVGCGQGRDAIPLAQMGYKVTGVDISSVGIEQMQKQALEEKLTIEGLVTDVYAFQKFNEYDVILLNSMFHFAKNDFTKETTFVQRIFSEMNDGAIAVFCIQDSGEKVDILNGLIDKSEIEKRLVDLKFDYVFEDKENNHSSTSAYRLIVIEK